MSYQGISRGPITDMQSTFNTQFERDYVLCYRATDVVALFCCRHCLQMGWPTVEHADGCPVAKDDILRFNRISPDVNQ